jgi:hypothetical protein
MYVLSFIIDSLSFIWLISLDMFTIYLLIRERQHMEVHMRRHDRCCPEALCHVHVVDASCLICEEWHLILP